MLDQRINEASSGYEASTTSVSRVEWHQTPLHLSCRKDDQDLHFSDARYKAPEHSRRIIHICVKNHNCQPGFVIAPGYQEASALSFSNLPFFILLK